MVQVYLNCIHLLNIMPSTTHHFFSIHNFFKSTPKLVLVRLSSCFPLCLFLFPLSVSNSISQFKSYFPVILFKVRNGVMFCLLKLSTSP